VKRAAYAVALTLAWVGAAEAATINGTGGPDKLFGTDHRDVVDARAGNDRITVHLDDARDSVSCGGGHDVVVAGLRDRAGTDCEVVSVELMRDPFGDPFSQHETAVEPDSFAAGRTIVSVFQVGRLVDGGADGIGFATSRNAGRTWRRGLLEGLGHSSDPVIAYDAAHRRWLAATLGIGADGTELRVSGSRDGLRWAPPVRIQGDEDYDKEWIACDNGRASPFRGRCYLAYLGLAADRLAVRHSTDGGRTWSPPAHPPAAARSFLNGAFPVVRPDGALVVLYTAYGSVTGEAEQIAAVRSTDGGLSFSAPVTVSTLNPAQVWGMRAPPFVSAETDAAGTIYAAWQDCLDALCAGSELVLGVSRDGVQWSAPRRLPVGNPAVDYFVPGLAVDPATSGRTARLAVAYHSLEQGCSLFFCRGVEVWLIRSADGGASWTPPRRLTAQPMPIGWIADTGLGRMLGDYISTSYVGGRPIAVFALASAPLFGGFRQGIFATTRSR
jgi:BNR/Asp-box repeat